MKLYVDGKVAREVKKDELNLVIPQYRKMFPNSILNVDDSEVYDFNGKFILI